MAEGPSKDGACVFALAHQIRREMIQNATFTIRAAPVRLQLITTSYHIYHHLYIHHESQGL